MCVGLKSGKQRKLVQFLESLLIQSVFRAVCVWIMS
jgi:hypothetical protein